MIFFLIIMAGIHGLLVLTIATVAFGSKLLDTNSSLYKFTVTYDRSVCDYYNYHKPNVSDDYKHFYLAAALSDKGTGGYKKSKMIKDQVIKIPHLTVCNTLHVELKRSTTSAHLKEILDVVLNNIAKIDEHEKFAQIIINIFAKNRTEYYDAASAIDTFLSPRPWWMVAREPFFKVHVPVILKRYPRFESYLRFIAGVQYPKDCSSSPLMVGMHLFIHPGWWSVIQTVKVCKM
jgi:hypothetical protein